MLTLLKSCELFSPKPAGLCDILLGGTKILAIGKQLFPQEGIETKIVNCSGYKVFPGLIDPVCFICGDGNENGSGTKYETEAFASGAKQAGISTMIGTLGWNDITRDPGTILKRLKRLEAYNLNAKAYTGGFRGNSSVMMKDIASDLTYINEYVATGTIGLSDHRAGMPAESMLANVHAGAEAGAELGNKSAVVVYILGEEKQHYAHNMTMLNKMVPVFRHAMLSAVNRNADALEAGKKFGMKGLVNIVANTTGFFQEDAIPATTALKEFLRAGVPMKNITISSFAGIEPVKPNTPEVDKQFAMYYSAFCESISDNNIPTDIVARVFSSNVASTFKLPNIGVVEKGMDADVLVATNDYKPVHLFIKGKQVLKDRKITAI